MEENLSTTGVILEILGDLELPLLYKIKEKSEGYEVMVSLPNTRRINKEILQSTFTSKGFIVVEIDVFREKGCRYAWFIVKEPDNEVVNG